MRKRIAVARGIITLPKIIFFDELDICKIILNASHPRLINALIKKKEALRFIILMTMDLMTIFLRKTMVI